MGSVYLLLKFSILIPFFYLLQILHKLADGRAILAQYLLLQLSRTVLGLVVSFLSTFDPRACELSHL